MKKAVVAGLLMLAIGFVLWKMIAGEFFNPTDNLAAKINKENFTWLICPNCGKVFMVEETTKRGYCPYCKFEMMLTEDKKVLGRSVDGGEFIWFFSPACGKVFFAFETKEMGNCPYCGEPISLTAPPTKDLEEAPHPLVALTKTHSGKIILVALGLFIGSIAGIYVLLESRVVLSLNPIEGTLSEGAKIELSQRQAKKKKKLTLGDSASEDIVLKDPSLKDIHYILSFVRVGGKTHAYLRQRSNQPVWVNDKPQYNAHLKDHDKVRIGDVVFEVHTRDG